MGVIEGPVSPSPRRRRRKARRASSKHFEQGIKPWQPKKYVLAATPAPACCAASTFWPTRSRSRSARRAATSCSTSRYGAPRITKDGVTVAKEIELSDKFENMGAQMVREVATRTSDTAGDGTTTATVLAQAIVREGAKSVAAGMNPMDLKRGIDLAVEGVIEDLKSRSKKVSTSDGDRPGRHDLGQRRQGDRRHDRQGDGEGRQGGRDHGRGSQEHGDRARRRRRHAVRPRLSLALLRHQRREDDRRAREPLHPASTRRSCRACRRCCRCSRRSCSRAGRC